MKGRDRFLKGVFFLFMIVPVAWSAVAFGATLNVPSVYSTIQAAVDAAVSGDTVLVTDGTYSGPGNVNLIVNKPIEIKSEHGPNLCIIDCQGNGRALTFTGAETEGSLLSGFTIRGGKVLDKGGGILCENGAKPTIDDCIITGNEARQQVGTIEMGFGGGIACVSSSPVISNCHIEGNGAGYGGGGVFCIGSSPTITGCTIIGNNCGNSGGGVYMGSKSSPAISSCMVTGNSATLYGGGFYASGTSSPSITNCTVADNSTPNAENTEGGGMYLYYGCQVTIANAIFWDNSAFQGPEIRMKDHCNLKVSFSNIKGGKNNIAIDALTLTASTSTASASTLDWSDDTNMDVDPRFVGEDDYHLASDSPCVDAGTKEDVTLPESDFEGDPRVLSSSTDMGGDEVRPEPKVYEVKIDVRPGSRHNIIHLGSWGFLPVAVLSTPDFDATSIDPETVVFAGAEPVYSVRARVNRDRKADMLFFFWKRHLKDLNESSTEATLTGQTTEDLSISGTDTVTIIKPTPKKHWWHNPVHLSQKKGNCNSK